MPALDQNVKIICGFCGTSVTKQQPSRHKARWTGGTLFCPKSPTFSTKSRDYINYQIAKKHSAAGPKNKHICKDWSIDFPSFYSLTPQKTLSHSRNYLKWRGGGDAKSPCGRRTWQKLGSSILMRTTPCWNSQNLWVTKTTWQNWKRFWRRPTWLSHAQKKGPIRKGGFLNY